MIGLIFILIRNLLLILYFLFLIISLIGNNSFELLLNIENYLLITNLYNFIINVISFTKYYNTIIIIHYLYIIHIRKSLYHL